MTQFPPDDQPLVDFLRQHRPSPPDPAPDLEQRLLASLRDIPQEPVVRERVGASPIGRSRRALWLIPSAIAAGVLATWAAQQFLLPSTLTPAEVSSLESFMETSWQGSVAQEPDVDAVSSTNNE